MVDVTSAFHGENLSFSVTGSGASVDAVDGIMTLSTDRLLEGERITITAKNSGGSVSSSFLLWVRAAIGTRRIHVATSGSDSNDGLSATAPILTLARALQVAVTGDAIMLRRGDIWRESLILPTSGLSITAYGDGAAPIISGADVVCGWTSTGRNHWTAPFGTEPIQVFVNGIRGERQAQASDLAANGQWHWSPNILRVYSTTTPTAEATVRQFAVNTNNRADTRISGLHLQRARVGIAAHGASGFHLDGCTISGCYTMGFNGGGDRQTDDVTIRGNVVIDIAGTGIGFGGRIHNWIIEDNIISECARLTQHVVEPIEGWRNTFQFTSGIKNWGYSEFGWTGFYTIRNNQVRNCRPYSDWATIAPTTATHGVGIWLDEIFPCAGVRPHITLNVVSGCNSRGIYLEKVDDHDVDHNIVHNCAAQAFAASLTLEANSRGWDLELDQSALVPRSARRNRIRHNTVVGGYWCFAAAAVDENCRLDDNIVCDNIFFKDDNITALFNAGAANHPSNGSGNIYTNNSWGKARSGWIRWGGWDAVHLRSTYESLPAEFAGYIVGDALFADASAENFSLRTGSPCINAASKGGNVGAL